MKCYPLKKELTIIGALFSVVIIVFAINLGMTTKSLEYGSCEKIELILKKCQAQNVFEGFKAEVRTCAAGITNPQTAADYFLKGYAAQMDDEEPFETLMYYQQAIRLDSTRIDAYSNSGVILSNLGYLEKAETFFRQAREINPIVQEIEENRGIKYIILGNNVIKANVSWPSMLILLLVPGFWILHLLVSWHEKTVATNKKQKPNYDKLMKFLITVSDEDNLKYVEDYFNGTYRKSVKGQYFEIPYEQRYIDADTYFSLAAACAHNGKYRDALYYHQQAVRKNPGHADAYHGMGLAYRHLGQYDEAIQSYQKAIELDHTCQEAYHNCGSAFMKRGRAYHKLSRAYYKGGS